MDALTVGTKGQITVPKHLREQLKLHPGARVLASVDAAGRLVLTPALLEPAELFANRPAVARALSLDEIDDAIRQAASA